MWNSLEAVKLIVGALTPISVFLIGWFLNKQLKRQEQVQQRAQKTWEAQLSRDLWSQQRLTEKKLLLYDAWAPRLNALFCFYRWVGYWKDITPPDVVAHKRELDKEVNIYRYIIGEAFYRAYNQYMHILFLPYQAPGHDAKIRSQVRCAEGDRTVHLSYVWDPGFDALFAMPHEASSFREVEEAYAAAMSALQESIGIADGVAPAAFTGSNRTPSIPTDPSTP